MYEMAVLELDLLDFKIRLKSVELKYSSNETRKTK